MNPLDRISSYQDDFTKTDSEIATYILKHPHQIATQNIGLLSKQTNSSKSAIVRFTKKIGYSGYAEFRIELSRSLIARNNELENTSSSSAVQAIPKAYSDCLLSMTNTISSEQCERIANLIHTANRIKIFGINRTYQTARQLMQRLSRMGYDSQAIYDSTDMQDAVDMANTKDVFIIFTTRGKGNFDLLVRELKQKDVTVIIITMSQTLSYLKLANEAVILPAIDHDTDYSFLDNQAIFFVYIEIILNILANIEVSHDR